MTRIACGIALVLALAVGPAGASAQVLKSPDEINTDVLDEALSGLMFGLNALIACDPDATLSYEGKVTDTGARLTSVSGSWRGFNVVAGDVVEVFDPVGNQGGFAAFLTLLAPGGPALAISSFGLLETSGRGGTLQLETNTFYPALGGDPPLVLQTELNDVVLDRRPTAVLPDGTQHTTASTGVETHRSGGELGDLTSGGTETKVCLRTCSDVSCLPWTPACTKLKTPGAEAATACRVRSTYAGIDGTTDPFKVTGQIGVVVP